MNKPNRKTSYLYFIACVANLMSFAVSVSFGWIAPSIPKLTGNEGPENNPLGDPIGVTDLSLLTSLYIVGSFLGPFLSSPLIPKFGRKVTILLLTIPLIASFLMKAFATTIGVLFAARILGGLSGGSMYTLVPVYVAELADNNNRGALGVLTGVFPIMGTLYVYVVGSYTPLKVFTLCSLITPALLFAILPFLPETPYFYIAKNRRDEAIQCLRKIRACTEEELLEETDRIQSTIEATATQKVTLHDMMASKALKKSLVINTLIKVLEQTTGVYGIMGFLNVIFQKAGNSISPEASTVVVAITMLFSYLTTLITVDRLGRRPLLLCSGVVIFLSLITTGTFFFLQDEGHDVENIMWIPLVSIMVFTIAYSLGLGIVPVVLTSEMLPQAYKSLAIAVIYSSVSAVTFLVLFLFPLSVEGIGWGPTFWLLSISGALAAIFTYFYIPETKGKTFNEIQEILEK